MEANVLDFSAPDSHRESAELQSKTAGLAAAFWQDWVAQKGDGRWTGIDCGAAYAVGRCYAELLVAGAGNSHDERVRALDQAIDRFPGEFDVDLFQRAFQSARIPIPRTDPFTGRSMGLEMLPPQNVLELFASGSLSHPH